MKGEMSIFIKKSTVGVSDLCATLYIYICGGGGGIAE